jgi:hypothetical protein
MVVGNKVRPGDAGTSRAVAPKGALSMQKKPYPLEKTTERGIYKRGGRYVVVFRDPAGRQRKRFARTFAEARDLKAKLRADIRRGEWREDERSGDLSFEQYAREWCDTYKGRTQRGVREHTLNDYRARLELDAIPFFGSRPLAGIGPRDVKKFIAHVESRGVSYNTVRLASAPVRALFATAFEDELITRNPTLGVRITRPEEWTRTGTGRRTRRRSRPKS